MQHFARNLESFGDRIALVTAEGETLSYGMLAARADAFAEGLGDQRRLVWIEAENAPEPIIAYLGALRAGHVVLLAASGRDELSASTRAQYRPDALYTREDGEWRLECSAPEGGLHEALAVLLSTSGTTGSAKLVRLSHTNLDANARSIADYLGIDERQRAITALPYHYCYGLSVLNSHLARGASLVLTDASLTDASFWAAVREHGVTSFACVPYSFEILERMKFEEMELPSLEYITQAGGRLAPDRVEHVAALATRKGFRFFVMYGQTEATARIAYLPPTRASAHPGCIGVPIPGGEIRLEDDDGTEVLGVDVPGELVYRGPNVMLGYATERAHLTTGPELDALRTGDLACRNAEGLYYVVGRKSRFSKLFGLRVNLDDVEKYAAAAGFRAICGGDDERLVVATLDAGRADALRSNLSERFGLPEHIVDVVEVEDYPLLPSGKVDYRGLAALGRTATSEIPAGASPIRDIFVTALGTTDLDPEGSFVLLGGDSLSYVHVSMQIESHLGYLPDDWENRSLRALEALEPGGGGASRIETGALVRALAITGVVLSHSKLMYISGGAYVLLMISGANFARFKGAQLFEGRVVSAVVSVLRNILVSYWVISGLYHLHKKVWDPSVLLLYGNWITPKAVNIFPIWFIQVLVQCVVLMALLFLLKPVRSLAERRPWEFGIGVTLALLATRTFVPDVWDANHLYNRVPHMLMWLFSLGFAIHYASTPVRKSITSGLLLLSMLGFAEYLSSAGLWLVLGGLAVLWRPTLPMPRPIKAVVVTVSAAAFHIYLTHMIFFHPFREMMKIDIPILLVVSGMLGGTTVWWVSSRVGQLVGHLRAHPRDFAGALRQAVPFGLLDLEPRGALLMRGALTLSLAANLVFAAGLGVYVVKKGGPRYVLEQLGLVRTVFEPFEWQSNELERFRAVPDTSDEIVFAGDSITAGVPWSEYFSPVRNRGIGGDRTDGILQRLDEITGREPRQIFLNVGINDLAAEISPREILENYARILTRIRNDSPGTEVVIASLLPINLEIRSDVRLAKKQRHIAVVNRGLFELAVEAEVVFVDLHPVFADENGHLRRDLTSGDGLHLNDLGNDLYARSMARYVRSSEAEALARRPLPDPRSHAALETDEERPQEPSPASS